MESVKCSDARHEFITAEYQAMDYLIKTPDKAVVDFYSPVMSLAKGLEILLDQEITVDIRKEIKRTKKFWNDRTGIPSPHFGLIEPDNLKWALSMKKNTISLGTWSRLSIRTNQEHEIMKLIGRYLEDRFGTSFDEIKNVCKSLEDTRNAIAHSKLMSKDKAKKIYFDSVTKINSVIRILYGEKQGSSPKIVISEIEKRKPDELYHKGDYFLQSGDFEFADLIFEKALEKMEKSYHESSGESSGEPDQKNKGSSDRFNGSVFPYAKLCLMRGIAQKKLNNPKYAEKCFRLAKKYDSEISDDSILEDEEFIQRRIETLSRNYADK